MHPSAQDDLPYFRIAVYATRAVRIWTWPDPLWRRVLLAALNADGKGAMAIAIAAIDEACRIMKEASRSTDDGRRMKGEWSISGRRRPTRQP